MVPMKSEELYFKLYFVSTITGTDMSAVRTVVISLLNSVNFSHEIDRVKQLPL